LIYAIKKKQLAIKLTKKTCLRDLNYKSMFNFDTFTKKVSRNIREGKSISNKFQLITEVKYTLSNKQRFEKAYRKRLTLPDIPEDIYARRYLPSYKQGNEYFKILLYLYNNTDNPTVKYREWFELEILPKLEQLGIQLNLQELRKKNTVIELANPEDANYTTFIENRVVFGRDTVMYKVNNIMEKSGIKPESMSFINIPTRMSARTILIRYLNIYANWSVRDKDGEGEYDFVPKTIEVWFNTSPNIISHIEKNIMDMNSQAYSHLRHPLNQEQQQEQQHTLSVYEGAKEYDPIQAIFEHFTKCINRLENKDIFSYGTLFNLLTAIQYATPQKEKITASIKGIAQKQPSFGYIGEDNTSIVVCPQTAINPKGVMGEEFSYKFFGGGKEVGRTGLITGARKPGATWCTAVEGGHHYNQYTSKGDVLLYFVKKSNEDLGAIRFTPPLISLEAFLQQTDIRYRHRLQKDTIKLRTYGISMKNIKEIDAAEKEITNLSHEQLEQLVDGGTPGSITSITKIRAMLDTLSLPTIPIHEFRNIHNALMPISEFLYAYTDIDIYTNRKPALHTKYYEMLQEWITKYIFHNYF